MASGIKAHANSKKKPVKRATKKHRSSWVKKKHPPGTLIIIGGREDKTGSMEILREIAARTGPHKMVIATLASQIPHEVWPDYQRVFGRMGVTEIEHFFIDQHHQASDPAHLRLFDNAHTVFFTGGDQLKITTKIGGTPIYHRIMQIFKNGGIIAGTSAGAAMMGTTMLVGRDDGETHKVGNWLMAPGLGFADEMIIDQHFAQRGRIGRLLGAVAMNPGVLGIGIDEDTSIILQGNQFQVLGTNAIYVVDGHDLSYTNISEAAAERTMSMHDVRLHILAHGEIFNLKTRKPSIVPRPG